MKTEELKKYIENMLEHPDSNETIAGYLKSNDVSYPDLVAVIRLLMKKPVEVPPIKNQPCKTGKEAAKLIRQAAMKWKSSGYANFPNDKKMRDAYDKDACDLYAVSYWIDKGDNKEAAKQAYHLDTVVRDCIPQPAWDYLEKFNL